MTFTATRADSVRKHGDDSNEQPLPHGGRCVQLAIEEQGSGQKTFVVACQWIVEPPVTMVDVTTMPDSSAVRSVNGHMAQT